MTGGYAAALQICTPLAEEGDLNARFKFANMYQRGQGVPQDYKNAVKWYALPAELGSAVAQYDLGLMYNFLVRCAPRIQNCSKMVLSICETG